MDGSHGVCRLNIRDTNDLRCHSSCGSPCARGHKPCCGHCRFDGFLPDARCLAACFLHLLPMVQRGLWLEHCSEKKGVVVMHGYFLLAQELHLARDSWLAPVSVGYRRKDVLYRTSQQAGPNSVGKTSGAASCGSCWKFRGASGLPVEISFIS
jgi:hypothetical protein